MPVLSTSVALSSSQEDSPPAPESASIARLAGKATYLGCSNGESTMAVAPTTMLREPRYVLISGIHIVQMS